MVAGGRWLQLDVEIRATTIQAVEHLRQALAALGKCVSSCELDWFLWQQGEEREEKLPPFHRTLTYFY